jgi:hypothetical protein
MFINGQEDVYAANADGERMNPPGRGDAYAPIPEDDDHQGAGHLENCLHPGARRPRTPLSMGSSP